MAWGVDCRILRKAFYDQEVTQMAEEITESGDSASACRPSIRRDRLVFTIFNNSDFFLIQFDFLRKKRQPECPMYLRTLCQCQWESEFGLKYADNLEGDQNC